MKVAIQIFLCCLLFEAVIGCKNFDSEEGGLKFYSTVLDQIVYDNYFKYCLEDEGVGRIDSTFSAGLIGEAQYVAIVDSLKLIRKVSGRKCRIEYSDQLGVHTRDSIFDDDIKQSIQEILGDNFFKGHFENLPINSVLDKLSRPAKFDISRLQIPYMDFVRHDRSTTGIYGRGIGVIAVSEIYFSDNYDKAILYYEFNCGPLCGHGQLVFLGKEGSEWKILEYKRVWDS